MISLLRRLQRPLFAVGLLALLALAWRAGGGRGVALVGSGLVLWGLLHMTRLLHVLHRASQRPLGHVDSAVMLNARLRAGQTLLHVLALTRALGQRTSAPNTQPEVYRWSDTGGDSVQAEFEQGRLVRWSLTRQPAAHPGPVKSSQGDSP